MVIDWESNVPVGVRGLDTWHAAVAVDAICVRQGRPGWARSIHTIGFGRFSDPFVIQAPTMSVKEMTHTLAGPQQSLTLSLENGHMRPPNPHSVINPGTVGNITGS